MKDKSIQLGIGKDELDDLDIPKRYQDFASVYNQKVEEWGYRAFQKGAELLNQYLNENEDILDAGCGTGLVGMALSNKGFTNITGIDASPEMLEESKKHQSYKALYLQDMRKTPFRFDENSFNGIICIGVLSLIPDIESLLAEFIRLTKHGGYIVFSQKEDLCKEREYEQILQMLTDKKCLKREFVSKPEEWLPNREGYENDKMLFFVFQVLKA
ncbi:MAG: class I SAM-dependent methyltransferase [Balneola sp.]|nr:MAG: class I SAM-dependent methyltransferase [Balneola sp.]